MATLTFSESITMIVIHCANCGVPFAISDELQSYLRKSHNSFYCPNGHSNVYSGLNESEKLRAELKRKEQELADKIHEKIIMQNELESTIKKQNTKLKRLTNGVCPCCNKSFENLQRHMKTKHPTEVSKER